MASTKMEIDITADASDAQASLMATAAAADRAAGAAKDLNKALAGESSAASMFREQAKAVEEQAAAFRAAAKEARQLQQIERDRAKLAALREKNSLGSQLSDMARGALTALPAAAADGGNSDAAAPALQFIHKREDNPCTACTNWMPERNRSSIDIDLLRV
jgi:hypothetical protein